MSWYKAGRISVLEGSKIVTGVGTAFIENVTPGFGLLGPDFSIYEVESVQSATQVTLATAYRGSDAVEQAYGIWQTQATISALTKVGADLLNTFGAFRDAYESGELNGKGLEVKGILSSAADLPASPAVGDTYLVRTTLYVWVAAGWRSQDIAGVVPRGDWSAAVAYAYNDTVSYGGAQYRRLVAGTTGEVPAADSVNWGVFVERGLIGPPGITPRGAWSANTAYVINDTATYSGSQYRRLTVGTSAGAPSSDNANWDLWVSKGLDGAGSVVTVNGQSPDSAGNVVLTTDKVGESGGILYHTAARVRAVALTGLSVATNAVIDVTDSVLSAMGKLQAQISAAATQIATIVARTGDAGAVADRNRVLNGDFRINQRGYVSGAATTAANQFCFDGWFIVTSGQNVSYAASGNGNLLTVPAGGLGHVIRGADIEGGAYTLSWTGTATATVNGAAVANGGQTPALTANSNVVLKFAGGTLGKVMFELGTKATVFPQRPLAAELLRCKERYQFLKLFKYSSFAGQAFGSAAAAIPVRLPVAMLSAPSVVLPPSGGNNGQMFFTSTTGDSPTAAGAHAVASQTVDSFYISASGYSGTGWSAGSGVLLFAPSEVAIQCSAELVA